MFFLEFGLVWTTACLIKHKLAIYGTFVISILCVCMVTLEPQMFFSSILACEVTEFLHKSDQASWCAEEDFNSALFLMLSSNKSMYSQAICLGRALSLL